MASNTRHIHFLSDVKDYGAAYECERCGHLTATKIGMVEHRGGLISPCFRTRLARRIRSLRSGGVQEDLQDD